MTKRDEEPDPITRLTARERVQADVIANTIATELVERVTESHPAHLHRRIYATLRTLLGGEAAS